MAGGSIGGLTTGVLLRELGCEVEVYERSGEELEDRGAGIVVLPITERYFVERGGPDDRVSLELTYWSYVDSRGEIIGADADHLRFSGWSTIYRALLDEFGPDRYHHDHEVVGFDQDETKVVARFGDGSTAEGDLLVFADGFGSTGRGLLLPEVRPEYAGYVAWRGTTPEADLSASARSLLADAMVYQVLDHGHILVYAIPDRLGRTAPPDRLINFVWYRNYPAGQAFDDLMLGSDGVRRTGTMPPGSIRDEHIDEMRETAREVLSPALLEVVLECGEPLIQAVFDVHSPEMVFGHVVLIGDAATTLRPHIAAGQAKACADAWALRDALTASSGDLDRALADWGPRQVATARQAYERSKRMGIASQFDGTMVPGDPGWKFGLWEPGN